MSSLFRRSAFAPWVPGFVAWSNRQSDIHRPPTESEIAAHRGLFALERIEIGHLAMFVRHVVGPAALPPSSRTLLTDVLDELGPVALDVDAWLDRFVTRRPLDDGNGRSARALWMWHRSGLRDPAAGTIDPDVRTVRGPPAFEDHPALPH